MAVMLLQLPSLLTVLSALLLLRRASAAAGTEGAAVVVSVDGARPSLIPSLCTRFTRAGIEWRR